MEKIYGQWYDSDKAYGSVYLDGTLYGYKIKGDGVVPPPPPPPVLTDCIAIESLDDAEQVVTFLSQGSTTQYLSASPQYSFDRVEWINTDLTSPKFKNVTIPANGTLYLRGYAPNGYGKVHVQEYGIVVDNYLEIYGSGNARIYGSLPAMINYQDPDSVTGIPSGCFYNMFSRWPGINDISNLSFGNIGFVNSAGMAYMFENTAITKTPDLSGITFVAGPTASYDPISWSGMMYAFYGCTSLNYVTAPSVSSWNSRAFIGWLGGVASSGVVSKPAALTIPTGTADGVPSGWTTIDR